MNPLVYILVPLLVLVIGLFWKFRQASRGEQAGSAASPTSSASSRKSGLAGVHQLVAEGNKLAAIKLLKDTTGMDLKAAKDAVDLIEQARSAVPGTASQVRATPTTADDDPEIRRLVAARQYIEAIKRYRELTGLGLKESKEAVDRLRK